MKTFKSHYTSKDTHPLRHKCESVNSGQVIQGMLDNPEYIKLESDIHGDVYYKLYPQGYRIL